MVIGFDASRSFVLQRTGTESYSYQLLKALLKIDSKNTYRIYVRNLPNAEFKLPSNASFKIISWPRLWTQGGLAVECFFNPPDVLFIPAHTLPVMRRPNLKTVVTIHDLGAEYLPQYHQFPQKYYLNWSTVYAVKHATRIIAVSESTKKDLITNLQCDVEVISMIYEGVVGEKFQIFPPTAGSRFGGTNFKYQIQKVLQKYNISKPYILFVGTIQPRKNLTRLIEAFSNVRSILASKHPNINLILVGKPGWLYEEIYAAPKKFGVEDRVKFLNFVSDDDLAILYKEASVFCLPSLYEGFGLPVLEAMSYGIPIVASNTSSLPELVGDAGLLVDPNEADDIAKSLEKILLDETLRNEMIKKGKKRAKLFTWEKNAQKTLTVLEETYRS